MDEWGRVGDCRRGWGVGSHSLVFDISNIARVSVSNVVGDHLGAAVGKGNAVLAVGGVAVTSLVLAKVGARVLISNTVLVSVDGWGIIGGLLVAVDGLGWVVWSWGWLVSRSGVDNGLVDDWGGMVDWSSVDHRLVDNGSWVVDRGGVVWGRLVDWHVGWSMHSSAVLLSGVGVVHILGSGMGLLGNNGSI